MRERGKEKGKGREREREREREKGEGRQDIAAGLLARNQWGKTRSQGGWGNRQRR